MANLFQRGLQAARNVVSRMRGQSDADRAIAAIAQSIRERNPNVIRSNAAVLEDATREYSQGLVKKNVNARIERKARANEVRERSHQVMRDLRQKRQSYHSEIAQRIAQRNKDIEYYKSDVGKNVGFFQKSLGMTRDDATALFNSVDESSRTAFMDAARGLYGRQGALIKKGMTKAQAKAAEKGSSWQKAINASNDNALKANFDKQYEITDSLGNRRSMSLRDALQERGMVNNRRLMDDNEYKLNFNSESLAEHWKYLETKRAPGTSGKEAFEQSKTNFDNFVADLQGGKSYKDMIQSSNQNFVDEAADNVQALQDKVQGLKDTIQDNEDIISETKNIIDQNGKKGTKEYKEASKKRQEATKARDAAKGDLVTAEQELTDAQKRQEAAEASTKNFNYDGFDEIEARDRQMLAGSQQATAAPVGSGQTLGSSARSMLTRDKDGKLIMDEEAYRARDTSDMKTWGAGNAQQYDIDSLQRMVEKEREAIDNAPKAVRDAKIQELEQKLRERAERGYGIGDWIFGNQLHTGAIGAAAIAGTMGVAFGGHKSNAELYASPF